MEKAYSYPCLNGSSIPHSIISEPNTLIAPVELIIEVNGVRVELPRDLRGLNANAQCKAGDMLIRIGHCRLGVAEQLVRCIIALSDSDQPTQTIIDQAIAQVRNTQ